MGFFEKLKKGFELKQNTPSHSMIQKTHETISQLKKQLETTENSKLYLDLYRCYVEISDSPKKIECLKRITKLKPNDSYPLQQLAGIYSNELNDMEQAKSFQNMANKIKKSF